MKVFELMNKLAEMPAGADVEISAVMTVEDLTASGVYDTENDKALYSLKREVSEAEEASGTVFLYLD